MTQPTVGSTIPYAMSPELCKSRESKLSTSKQARRCVCIAALCSQLWMGREKLLQDLATVTSVKYPETVSKNKPFSPKLLFVKMLLSQ